MLGSLVDFLRKINVLMLMIEWAKDFLNEFEGD